MIEQKFHIMIREGGSYEEETCEHDFMCGYGGVHGYGVRGGKVRGGAGGPGTAGSRERIRGKQ